MKTISPIVLFLWLTILLLAACQSNPNISESGFGGTGAPVLANAEETSGFGGTGHSSSGFGGTGIIGTIQAFGSIWVNDIEIGYGEQTRITSNLSETDQLKLGQQVIVETLPLDNQTLTGEIYIHYPIAGKITEVSGSRLVIDHQYPVHLNDQTHQDSALKLTNGNYIAINGFKNADQSWTATRLNLNPQQTAFYQPEPQLRLNPRLTRWIVEPSLIQHNPWPMLRSLQRSQIQSKLPGNRRQLMETQHQQNAIHRQQMELQRHQKQQQQQQMKMGKRR